MNFKKYAIVDLHLHLDGSLSAKAIMEVAKKENIKLPANIEEELNKYLMVPENCESLNDYLTRFDLPNLVLQTKEGLKICTLDLMKRLADQGLKYAEIRMAPQLSTAEGLTQEEVVETLIKALREANKYGIYSNLILCMMRGKNNLDKNLETVKVAQKFLNKGVVAIDLAGAEALFPNEMFEKEFELINHIGIPLTIHCGEAAGAESVASALKYNPTRIGHGIHAVSDENVMKILKKRGICMEFCPKSNIDTKCVSCYEELPIHQFLKHKIKVSINTDDMTVSNTELAKEYETLVNLGYKEKELKHFAKCSILSSFASPEVKKLLLKSIK